MLNHARLLAIFITSLVVFTSTSAHAKSDNLWDRYVIDMGDDPTYLVPSFGVHLGWSKLTSPTGEVLKESEPHLMLWGGLTLHPQSNYFNLFFSGGVEVEFTTLPDGQSGTFFMPMIKAGAVWQAHCWSAKPNYGTAMFPCLSAYTLLGVRPAIPNYTGHALRAGFGINAPILTAFFAMGQILVPSSYEGLIEIDEAGNQMWTFRIGLAF